MPFDASTAAIDPRLAARPPVAQLAALAESEPAGPATPAPQRPSSIPTGIPAGIVVQRVAPAHPPAPTSVPFYGAGFPRPVAAIVPRISRGVL